MVLRLKTSAGIEKDRVRTTALSGTVRSGISRHSAFMFLMTLTKAAC